MACRTASLSGEPQGGECLRAEGKRSAKAPRPALSLKGGECLRAEGKRSAKAPRPALSLNPLSSAFRRALPRFLASAHAPHPVRCVLLNSWFLNRYSIFKLLQ